ncbi:MAG: radical SAM protein [Candidatus Omnitrophica bacterium]|nr:radical SAM protein [Candidatus Omnitrophota bacterium]
MLSNDPVQIKNNLVLVQDHSRHFSGFAFVYPVISRRSRGLSIGINLNPDKVCNFDCVYCEVDRRVPATVSRLALGQMRQELLAMIQFVQKGGLADDPRFKEVPGLAQIIRDIAFSGDGEPTLVHNFARCVQEVAAVKRSERLDQTKIVLITNATGLDKADVQEGLALLDANQGEIWAKLDAGTEAYFHLINRSHVQFERILQNLLIAARKRPIIIQTLFLRVDQQIIPTAELEAYCDRLNHIVHDGGRIKEVHAYTVARPTPEPFAHRLTLAELDALADVIRQKTGLTVLTFP